MNEKVILLFLFIIKLRKERDSTRGIVRFENVQMALLIAMHSTIHPLIRIMIRNESDDASHRSIFRDKECSFIPLRRFVHIIDQYS